jgi:hypothetical protein
MYEQKVKELAAAYQKIDSMKVCFLSSADT